MAKFRFLPFLIGFYSFGHFLRSGPKKPGIFDQTRNFGRDRWGGGRPPTRHLAFLDPPKKVPPKRSILAILTCMDFNCQNMKIDRFRGASKINFSEKRVKKRVHQNGPFLDPSKKSDFATNFFGISRSGSKSSIFRLFSTFSRFSTF